MLVEATPGRSDRILSSVLDSVMVVAESDDGTRSECGLLREAGSVLGGLLLWRRPRSSLPKILLTG